MDSSNNVLNVKLYDLERSIHPEDREMVAIYGQALKSILAKLKPVLRYICITDHFDNLTGVRCLSIGKIRYYQHRTVGGQTWSNVLYLSEAGVFFHTTPLSTQGLEIICCENNQRPSDIVRDGNDSWMHMPFLDLVNALKSVLELAITRREVHLTALNKRKEMLQEVVAMLERCSSS